MEEKQTTNPAKTAGDFAFFFPASLSQYYEAMPTISFPACGYPGFEGAVPVN